MECSETFISNSVAIQMCKDFETYMHDSKSGTKETIQEFASNADISAKTIRKIADKTISTTPHKRTVIQFYKYYYRTDTLSELMTKVDPCIADFIRVNISGEEISNFDNCKILDARRESRLTEDHLFCEIYSFVPRDIYIDIETIKEQFGKNGLDIVDQMLAENYLIINEHNQVTRSKKLNWSNKTIANFSKTLVTNILKSDDFESSELNYCSYFNVTTNKEDAILVKKTLQDAFKLAREISLKSQIKENDELVVLNFSTIISPSNVMEGVGGIQ